MEKKIKSVMLNFDFDNGYFDIPKGTVSHKYFGGYYYFGHKNENISFHYQTIRDIKLRHKFIIEYEQPKIKSITLKLTATEQDNQNHWILKDNSGRINLFASQDTVDNNINDYTVEYE